MKILQVTLFFKPSWEAGGVARVAYEISMNLVKKGHEVTVYTTDGFKSRLKTIKNKPIDVDGINTYYFRNLSNFLAKFTITTPYYLFFVARKEIKNFDIIHIHEHRTLLAIIVHYYSKKYNVPYVLQAHGSIPNTIGKRNLKKLFDALWGKKIITDASKIIAVSNIEIDQYLQMNISPEKIVVIPNGIDFNYFHKLPEKGTFRKKYNIGEKYIILYLGRLNEIKGIDFLIKSYARMLNEINDVILILAGPDDGYLNKAKSLVDGLDIKNRVKFIGFIEGSEKDAAYLDANMLVYPSIFEIFGLVPFEAIMCGTPVIVTDNCGCGELIKDSKSGYLVKYNDITSLKEVMKLILENPQKSSELVDNGRKFIYKKLSWDSIVKNMEENYENCIYNI